MLPERAVVNAGPLVGLSLAGRLELLPALFAEFWIPEIVFHEVAVAGLGLPGADVLIDARWRSHVRPAPDSDPLLVAELDPGEAATSRPLDFRATTDAESAYRNADWVIVATPTKYDPRHELI